MILVKRENECSLVKKRGVIHSSIVDNGENIYFNWEQFTSLDNPQLRAITWESQTILIHSSIVDCHHFLSRSIVFPWSTVREKHFVNCQEKNTRVQGFSCRWFGEISHLALSFPHSNNTCVDILPCALLFFFSAFFFFFFGGGTVL